MFRPLVLVAGIALLPATGFAEQEGTLHSAEANVFRPEQRPFSENLRQQLELPEGFEISVFARDLGNPRMIAVSDEGTVYVTRPEQEDVIAIAEEGGEPRTVASDLPGIHGIAIRDGRIYLATVNEILVADIAEDGSTGELEALVDDLENGGQHARVTLGFAPDGALHVNVGSSCNSCYETSDEQAANLRVNIEDGTRTVFAHGLRNTLGFDWHPETGEMWGLDQGVDHRGDEVPPRGT